MRLFFSAMVLVAGLICGPAFARDTAPVPAWIEVNGVVLRYQLTGNGDDVVVLLPSTGKTLEYWDELVPSLAKRNRTILRYDIRGSGLSQKLTEPVTMQQEVGDLEALLQALKLTGKVTMIGTAFGGSIQLQYAAQYPERVRGVIVVSPSSVLVPRKPGDPPSGPVIPPHPDDPYAVTYPKQLRTDPVRWSRFVGMERSNDPESKHFTDALIVSTPFADVVPKIQCPVLLVATRLYPRRTPENVEEFARSMPHAEVAIIDAGHDAPFQSPELVLPLLNKFLRAWGI